MILKKTTFAIAAMLIPLLSSAKADDGQPGITNALAAGCRTTNLTMQLNQAILRDKDATLDLLTAQWQKETSEGQPHICWVMPPKTKVLVRFPYEDFLCVSEIRWDTGEPSQDCYYVDTAVIDR